VASGKAAKVSDAIVLWVAFALWALVSIAASSSWSLGLVRIFLGAVALVAIRAVNWYVLPRIRSLLARLASADVDLEEFGQKMLERSGGKPDPAIEEMQKEIRRRYGRRVPGKVGGHGWKTDSRRRRKSRHA